MSKPSVVGAITRGVSAERSASSVDPAAPKDTPGADLPIPPTPTAPQAAETIPVIEPPPTPEYIAQPAIPPRANLAGNGPAKLLELWSDGAGLPTSIKGYEVPGGVIVITEQRATKAAGGGHALATTFVPGVKMELDQKDLSGRRWRLVVASKPAKV